MSSGEKRILLVDDDDDFAAAITAFLEQHGYAVHRAENGRAGLLLAGRIRPDLVLMDVMMGDRTEGFFTAQNLRRTPGLERVPIFVVSSLYSVEREFRVSPDPGWLAHDRFFNKPVDLPALLEAISARIDAGGGAVPAPDSGGQT